MIVNFQEENSIASREKLYDGATDEGFYWYSTHLQFYCQLNYLSFFREDGLVTADISFLWRIANISTSAKARVLFLFIKKNGWSIENYRFRSFFLNFFPQFYFPSQRVVY